MRYTTEVMPFLVAEWWRQRCRLSADESPEAHAARQAVDFDGAAFRQNNDRLDTVRSRPCSGVEARRFVTAKKNDARVRPVQPRTTSSS